MENPHDGLVERLEAVSFDQCLQIPFVVVGAARKAAARIRELEGVVDRLGDAWREVERMNAANQAMFDRARIAEAALTETLKERDEARASANHQRKQKQASNISRNRAAQGVEYWKARAERMEGALRRIVSRRNRVGLPDGFDQTMFDRAERVLAVRYPSSALSPPPSPQDLGSACSDQERTGTPAPASSTAVSDGEE